jgi:hypothetical protein
MDVRGRHSSEGGGGGTSASSTHLSVLLADVFRGFARPSGDVETGKGGTGAGWTSGDGSRVREAVVAASWPICSALGSSMSDVEPMGGRAGTCASVCGQHFEFQREVVVVLTSAPRRYLAAARLVRCLRNQFESATFHPTCTIPAA